MKEFKYTRGKTHSGKMHADEVAAAATLELIAEARGIEFPIERVFNVSPEDTNDSDTIVFDIGGGEYDHHQNEEKVRPNGVPYSSFGLIWRDFAQHIPDVDEEVQSVVDVDFVQGIDAHDNGILKKQNDIARIASTSGLINLFNPNWDENADYNIQFKKAVVFMKVIIKNFINRAASTCRARSIVIDAIKNADGGIMQLERYCPWQDYLLEDEEGKKLGKSILYVMFPSSRGDYNVQAVPKEFRTFKMRKALPEKWWGLTDRDLKNACGDDDATFCHKSGFLLATRTKESALRLARKAVEA